MSSFKKLFKELPKNDHEGRNFGRGEKRANAYVETLRVRKPHGKK